MNPRKSRYLWCAVLMLLFLQTIGFTVGESVKREFAFYKDKVSWNTANYVCQAIGGHLIKIDSESKANVLEYFFRQNDDPGDGDIWVGLFDNDIPRQSFTWTDCEKMTYNNWYHREPDGGNTDHCVRAEKNNLKWKTKDCDHHYQFVCEKRTGDCTFTILSHTDISPSPADDYDIRVLQGEYNSVQECQAQCQGSSTEAEKDCFGITHSASMVNPGTCSLYMSRDPLAVEKATTRSESGHTSSFRICHEAIKETYTISDSVQNNDKLPSIQCVPVVSTPPPAETSTPDILTSVEMTTTTIETPQDSSTPLASTTKEIPSTIRVSTPGQSSTWSTEEKLTLLVTKDTQATELTTDNMNTGIAKITTTSMEAQQTSATKEISSATRVSTARQSSTWSQNPTLNPSSTTEDNLQPLVTKDTETATGNLDTTEVFTDNTNRPTYIAPTSTDISKSTNNLCPCSCRPKTLPNEDDPVIASILETLTVEKQQVSSHKRKYVSAQDSRPTAQLIGYSGGGILGVVFVGLVILDLPKLVSDIKILLQSFRNFQ